MGISKRSNGSFYAKCDWPGCAYVEDLEASNFWDAATEAKKKGWIVAKDREGHWANFHTEFCKICFFAPQVTVYVPKNKDQSPSENPRTDLYRN